MSPAADTSEYLSIKLQRLDVLLHREILRLRARYQLTLDEFRGLYISDEQVNSLINQEVGYEGETSIAEELTERAEVLRSADDHQSTEDVIWRRLADEFALSTIEQDILLLALAPELDLKYETLYGYLNNDVTRKWPTHDLALRLFATNQEQKMRVRRCLAPGATLFSSGLLHSISAAPQQPWLLASGFSVAPVLLHNLLGFHDLESRLPCISPARSGVEGKNLQLMPAQQAAVTGIVNLLMQTRAFPLIVFTGREGTGRGTAAEAVCRELGIPLLRVDLAAIRPSPEGFEKLLQSISLHQRLQGASLYLERAEALFDEQGRPLPDSRRIIGLLAQSKSPIFIACEANLRWQDLLSSQRVISFGFDDPDYDTRLQLWKTALAESNLTVAEDDVEALADRFALTPAQIGCAAAAAFNRRALKPDSIDANPTDSSDAAALFAAARSQSDQSLGNLALKVRSRHTWEDLILPRLTLQRVKEIAAAIKNRHIVYSDWGFDRRIATGKGLKSLFAGGSGTGKTMAAGVIARELELDLYKIDLSGIVSKYIGETEKNLDRIFRAAQSSNAILFFDEADALFGKRSEVRDAHDRYANIEVAYLLQKIEDYEGVVILASNLSKNIDEAFSRRMHYVVEFPLPDENYRERLWRAMFPPEMPLGGAVDFQFLARKFPLAGGDIRNVALDAAFLAAQDGKVVTMRQLAKALARQMMKQGKIPSAMDFQQYHGLLVDGV
jgi:ATP-dependent 26S proteasome regulatory subunit